MLFPRLLRNLLGFTCLPLSGLLSFAAEIDLERTTPVPADQPIPIQDFFRMPLMMTPKLNTDGTHVAALIPLGEKMALLGYNLEKNTTELALGSGQFDIYSFDWLNKSRVVFSVSTEKLYRLGTLAVDVGSFNRAYPLLQYQGEILISTPRKNPTQPIYWLTYDGLDGGDDLGSMHIDSGGRNGRFINLNAANLSSEDFRIVEDNNQRHMLTRLPMLKVDDEMTQGYYGDVNGELRLALTIRGTRESLYYLEDKTWHKSPINMGHFSLISHGNTIDEVLMLDESVDDKPPALRRMNVRTGDLIGTDFEDERYGFTGSVFRDPATGAIAGIQTDRSVPQSIWFDPAYIELQATLEKFFPKMIVTLLGQSTDKQVMLVSVSSDRQPPLYHIVNLKKKSVSILKSSAPWLDPQRLRPMSIIRFKTREGKSLDAYLTLPEGASKQAPAPLIVLPHGGPFERDRWGFNSAVQFFASRGYAVLQPNYRASPGTSWMFPFRDMWDFPKMHDDVTDATKTALKTGLVDPKRIAIIGSSFGGYLAVSGVAHEPDLYRCAVTFAGVFDWGDFIREHKYSRYRNPTYTYMVRRLGDPKKEAEKFAAISPVNHVSKIKVPVFVAHGKSDVVVRVEQSEDLIRALKANNVPHETLIKSGEAHGLAHLKNEIEYYERVEAFLAKHLR